MFEYYNHKLCVESGALVRHGVMSKPNYDWLKKGTFSTMRRACKDTPGLILWDSIPERFRKLIVEKFGEPQILLQKAGFENYISTDTEALKIYRAHRLDNGKSLPEATINEYTANASILNGLRILTNDRSALRKALGGQVNGAWDKLTEEISRLDKVKYPHSLPANERRLRDKYNLYLKEGYESLIHANFCNQNSEKINEKAKLWILAMWANHVDKIAGMRQLFAEYNQRAANEGWKELKNPSTLYNFLNSDGVKEIWYGHRYGELKAKEKFSLQHKTKLPTMRDSLWYSDGTKMNYYYADENGNTATCQVYEVIDAYSEVFLGYHISRTEDFEAQFRAYKMAMQFSKCKPYQITYDNQGGHKKLEAGNFLNKIAHLNIKTQPYNGKSKSIESIFGRFQMEFLKRDWFFTGQNITAKATESRQNMEFILANKANLKSLSEVKEIYKQRRAEWNAAPHPKTGISRMEMYLTSSNPKAEAIGQMDMVDLFWILRKEPITCTASGIAFTEKKVKYEYLVYATESVHPVSSLRSLTGGRIPDVNWLRKNVDKKFNIRFDPDDMSLIYLYEDSVKGLRFVSAAETKVEVHRGKQEQEDWEAQYFADIQIENNEARIENRNKMDEILETFGKLPEQNGLNSPKIKGIETGKRHKKTLSAATQPDRSVKKAVDGSIGEYEKIVSNMVEAEEEESIYAMM